MLGEKPAVPRISDLGHLYSSSLGKLELDMMGSHQMSERQVLEAVIAEAIKTVFDEYVDQHGLDEIAEIFAKGVKIEVGDMLPSSAYTPSVLSGCRPSGTRRSRSTRRANRPCAPPASSSCWPGCTRWIAFRVPRDTAG